MDKSKRKRLEAKGWQVGSAGNFLGLSAEEEAYIAMKLALARKLTAKRKEMRCSQIKLAKLLHSSQSRVAKMEAGDASVSVDLLVRSLLTMGLSPREVSKALVAA